MRSFQTALVFAVLGSTQALAQTDDVALTRSTFGFRLEPIAIAGQPAPGIPGGTFAFFGPAPGVGGQEVGWATIGREGRIAFGAAVNVSSGSGTTTRHGIWHVVDGALQPLALQGDPAPGTGYPFSQFPSIYSTVSPTVAQRHTSFMASLQSGGNPSHGIWVDRSGVLELIALVPGALPGLPPSGSILDLDGQVAKRGLMVLTAGYSDDDDGGYIDPEQEGFWRDDGTSLQLVLRDDAHAPGCPPSVTFGKGTFFANGAFDHWDANL